MLKDPLVVDVAYNNVQIHWNTVQGVSGAIAKASEGLGEDSFFKFNWPGLAETNICRGAYHFYRWYWPSGSQAKKFVATLKKYGGIKPNDVLVLDEEEPGHMSLSAILDFLWNVEQLSGLSHKTNLLVYSWPWALNQLNPKKLKTAQLEYLRETHTWAGGYPNNPDLWSDPIKAGYIVDVNKFGKSVLWQYISEVPHVSTIPGGTDANWTDPAFLAWWRGTQNAY
jgi:GH25 family lysozyme M1 (1,4-beta-N-acetylmuramidase)